MLRSVYSAHDCWFLKIEVVIPIMYVLWQIDLSMLVWFSYTFYHFRFIVPDILNLNFINVVSDILNESIHFFFLFIYIVYNGIILLINLVILECMMKFKIDNRLLIDGFILWNRYLFLIHLRLCRFQLFLKINISQLILVFKEFGRWIYHCENRI